MRSGYRVLLWAASAISFFAWPARPALCQDASNASVQQGVLRYRNGDLAGARTLIEAAVQYGQLSRRDQAVAALYGGLVQFARDDITGAQASFVRATLLDPAVRLDGSHPPDRQELYRRARASVPILVGFSVGPDQFRPNRGERASIGYQLESSAAAGSRAPAEIALQVNGAVVARVSEGGFLQWDGLYNPYGLPQGAPLSDGQYTYTVTASMPAFGQVSAVSHTVMLQYQQESVQRVVRRGFGDELPYTIMFVGGFVLGLAGQSPAAKYAGWGTVGVSLIATGLHRSREERGGLPSEQVPPAPGGLVVRQALVR